MGRTPRLALMASGRGSNVVAILDAITEGQLAMEAALVMSDQEDAPVLREASVRKVPTMVLTPCRGEGRRAYGMRIGEQWGAHGIEVVALAGFMRILAAEVIEAFPGWIFNIHPSLLPSFPGLHAVRQALDYGVRVSGCTVHRVDAGVDTGPIILQEAVPVLEDDSEDALAARILRKEHVLYPRALHLHAEGRLVQQGRKVRIRND